MALVNARGSSTKARFSCVHKVQLGVMRYIRCGKGIRFRLQICKICTICNKLFLILSIRTEEKSSIIFGLQRLYTYSHSWNRPTRRLRWSLNITQKVEQNEMATQSELLNNVFMNSIRTRKYVQFN